MILRTLWQRYIFRQLLQGFFFFLFAFFLLYSLIDFATHAQDFLRSKQGTIQLSEIFPYYSYQFVKRLPLLLPLALLIATIRALHSLNLHRELVALQAAGVKLKKIFHPFLFLAFLCSCLGYLNEEVLTPQALVYSSKETLLGLNQQNKPFILLQLGDNSKLVYQKFDSEKNAFFDVYWIRSFQDIWRMKYLQANPHHPIGEYVDHITRNKDGLLLKQESYEKYFFPNLTWDESLWSKKQSSIKHQKISELLPLYLRQQSSSSFHLQGEIKTHLFYKIAMPLLSFLVFLGVAPFCVRYSRSPPVFMIYGCAIFAFVVFFAWINAMVIIGENQILSPSVVIFLPFLLCFSVAYWNFRRIL